MRGNLKPIFRDISLHNEGGQDLKASVMD